MNKIYGILILGFFMSSSLFSQKKMDGLWAGKINIQGMDLSIYIEIQEANDKAMISIPLQGLDDVVTKQLTVSGDSVEIVFAKFRATYSGVYNPDTKLLEGDWSQGKVTPIDLKRVTKKEELKRPQTPEEPFPYEVSDFELSSENEQSIAGTMTIPKGKGPFPAVILVSGSGGQDRNSEILKHKPFLVISDYLTRQGIAVFRYDDRGIGESKGSFIKATSEDFASDAEQVLRLALNTPNIDQSKVGIIGHSEGGMIAPMIAARNEKVGFIVSLAGPGTPISELMKLQNIAVYKSNGMSDVGLSTMESRLPGIYNIITQDKEPSMLYDTLITAVHGFYDELSDEDQKLMAPSKETYYMILAQSFFSPWYRYFLRHDPGPDWKKVTCPVFAVNGDKDIQVDAEVNINAIKSILKESGNKNLETKIYSGLNHLFQPCKVCNVGEYASIEITFDEAVLEDIVEFVLGL